MLMGIHERRQREQEEMQNRILEAATRLFNRYGLKQTSIRKIAEEIEYSPGTIYTYFRDKDEILLELIRRGHALLLQKLHTSAHVADPYERLYHGGLAYLTFAQEYPEYYSLMFLEAITPLPEHWEVGCDTYGALQHTVNDCLAQGCIRDGDSEAVTFACWSFVHGLASVLLRERTAMVPHDDLPGFVRSAYDYFHASLKAEATDENMRQNE